MPDEEGTRPRGRARRHPQRAAAVRPWSSDAVGPFDRKQWAAGSRLPVSGTEESAMHAAANAKWECPECGHRNFSSDRRCRKQHQSVRCVGERPW